MKNDAIAIIIRNQFGEVLLQYHNKLQAWTMPVGGIEEGETPEDALCREAQEELGIHIKEFRLIGSKLLKDKEYPANSGIFISVNQYYFEIDSFEGKVRNMEPDKHRELKWVKPCDMPSLGRKSAALDEWLYRGI